MEKINIVAIVKSVEESHSGYEIAIKELARKVGHCSRFTSEDVGISGSTLSWLAKYGVLKIVGTKQAFICVNEYNETYKKVDVNIYEIDCDILELARNFDSEKKAYKVQKIENRVARLREQLAEALSDLDEIE